MKHLYIIFITIIFFSCSPKRGSVAGNVYWKYNNFIGNKPDAGSDVFLFSSDTGKAPLQATCDIQGNFSLADVPVGDYKLVVRSKSTNASCYDLVYDLLSYINTPFMRGDGKYNGQVHGFIENYFAMERLDISDSRRSDSFKIYRNRTIDVSDSILKEIPHNSQFRHWVLDYGMSPDKITVDDISIGTMAGNKIKVKDIKVEEGKTTTEIVDFGLTFY